MAPLRGSDRCLNHSEDVSGVSVARTFRLHGLLGQKLARLEDAIESTRSFIRSSGLGRSGEGRLEAALMKHLGKRDDQYESGHVVIDDHHESGHGGHGSSRIIVGTLPKEKTLSQGVPFERGDANAFASCDRHPDQLLLFPNEPIRHEPPPAPKARKSKKPPPPPAVELFRQLTRRYPAEIWWPIVAEQVGDSVDALGRWQTTIIDWLGHADWDKGNLAGMLQAFGHGGVRQAPPQNRRESNLDRAKRWLDRMEGQP